MLNPQGEVFIGTVRKIKRRGSTRSGNPTYRLVLDNRTIDTKPDAAVNYLLGPSMEGNAYAFTLEYGQLIGFTTLNHN